MEVVISTTPDEAGILAADAIAELVRHRPEAVLGVATGSSPLIIYDELGRRVAQGSLSLAKTRAFMLDEYVGLAEDHPQRYRNVIRDEFVDKVDIDPAQVLGPDGLAADLVSACEAYERAIADAGGVDLQILGIGTDGHIAFNEPGSSLASRTRIKTLTSQTRRDNARFFGGDVESVPQHCLTQGIGTILQARHSCSWPRGAGRRRPSISSWRDPCQRCGRRRRYSCTRTSLCYWTPPPLRAFSSPRTTSRPTRGNRVGRGSNCALPRCCPGSRGLNCPRGCGTGSGQVWEVFASSHKTSPRPNSCGR